MSLEAEAAVRKGSKLIILSDRHADRDRVPVPSLLALGAVHQHLVKCTLRTQTGRLMMMMMLMMMMLSSSSSSMMMIARQHCINRMLRFTQ